MTLDKPKINANQFKNAHVGKSVNLEETLETLKNETLQHYWRQREFKEFLREIISDFVSEIACIVDGSTDLAYLYEKCLNILPLFEELGDSFDKSIHDLLKRCYISYFDLKYIPQDTAESTETDFQRRVSRYCNSYCVKLMCTEKSVLVTDEDLKWLLKTSAVNLITAIEEQTLKVEEELLQQRGTSASGYICHLQHIALNFIRHKSNIYPLAMARIPGGRKTVTSKFPESPGVYFIYYVGKTDLYKGSQVFPSLNNPVYVGMSETNISKRLNSHGRNIENARNLNLADFVVRFLIVDVKYYARCIEGLMIDYFSPVWNNETVGLAFGNATGGGNLWYQCHGNINPNRPVAYARAKATLKMVSKYLKI